MICTLRTEVVTERVGTGRYTNAGDMMLPHAPSIGHMMEVGGVVYRVVEVVWNCPDIFRSINEFGLPDALMHQLQIEGWSFIEIETYPATREIHRPDGSNATVQEAIEACDIGPDDDDAEHEETEVDRIRDTIADISEFYDWDSGTEVLALASYLDYLAKRQGVSSEATRMGLRDYLDEFGKAGG